MSPSTRLTISLKRASARCCPSSCPPQADVQLEPPPRGPLPLQLSAPGETKLAAIERHRVGDALVDLRDESSRIPIAIVELDREIAMVHFAIDHAFAGLQMDVRELRQRHQRA